MIKGNFTKRNIYIVEVSLSYYKGNVPMEN